MTAREAEPDAAEAVEFAERSKHDHRVVLPQMRQEPDRRIAIGKSLIDDQPAAARTDALVADLAAGARGSAAAVKKLLLTSLGNGLEEQMEIEGRLIAACAGSTDGREGIDAFLAKRAARFGGSDVR